MRAALDLRRDALEYVESRRERIVEIAQELIRRPSENTPPIGGELECQRYAEGFLSRLGWDTELYTPHSVPGLTSHPLYWPGRDYSARPNLVARKEGTAAGRSLILSGHVDTVPAGTLPWTRSPFSGHVEGNRLYGRGANDMKSGVAANLFVAEALADLHADLAGTLTVETVVDEEFGGVNGTVAARLRGITADAAILSEPSLLRVCPAQRSGRVAHVTLRSKGGGILSQEGWSSGVIPPLSQFLAAIDGFAAVRRAAAPIHPAYAGHDDPVPVAVTKVTTGPWGFHEPTTIPDAVRVEICWQGMPGETQESMDRHFTDWLRQVAPDAEVEYPIRWLPGSAMDADHPFVEEFAQSVRSATGRTPRITGIEGPCDLFVFHQFGIPALLWGARGGNTHAADEYVEIDSLVEATAALLAFVLQWCGSGR